VSAKSDRAASGSFAGLRVLRTTSRVSPCCTFSRNSWIALSASERPMIQPMNSPQKAPITRNTMKVAIAVPSVALYT